MKTNLLRLFILIAALKFGVFAAISEPAPARRPVQADAAAQGSPADQPGAAAFCKSGFSYNVLCYGADPTGKSDSSPAIQQALDKAQGAPVEMPAGKYLLMSAIVIQAGNNSPGPRLEGAGQGVTVLEPCFAGQHPMPAAGGAIVVDGTRKNGAPYVYRFAYGGYLRGFSIDGAMARATHPSQHCPDAQAAHLDGIEISGWWQGEVEDLDIEQMGGDAVDVPWRHDLRLLPGCDGPDCFATAETEFKHLRLKRNYGWGLDAGAGIAFTYSGITESAIENNEAGGIYMFGWQNFVVNNAIASNGCTFYLTGTCPHSEPGGASSPQPGGGILLARFNPESTVPNDFESVLGARIERNEFDSNYGYDIWEQSGDNAQIIGNRFLNHDHLWRTRVQGDYPGCQVTLGFPKQGARGVVRNTYLRNNLTRSDSNTHGAADYGTVMYCIDPTDVAQTHEELDTTFGPNTNNFTVLAAGGGAKGACSQSGGRLTECEVQVGGWYPANSTPQIRIAGAGCAGQTARAQLSGPAGGSWGWVSSIQIENPGRGCTGDVWPVFLPIPYPKANRMQNVFQGYNPQAPGDSLQKYQVLTGPGAR